MTLSQEAIEEAKRRVATWPPLTQKQRDGIRAIVRSMPNAVPRTEGSQGEDPTAH